MKKIKTKEKWKKTKEWNNRTIYKNDTPKWGEYWSCWHHPNLRAMYQKIEDERLSNEK